MSPVKDVSVIVIHGLKFARRVHVVGFILWFFAFLVVIYRLGTQYKEKVEFKRIGLYS